MRDFLVSHLPDPGALIFLGLAAVVFVGLFCMVTDKRKVGEPVEHDTAPQPPEPTIDPESDARRRAF